MHPLQLSIKPVSYAEARFHMSSQAATFTPNKYITHLSISFSPSLLLLF